MDLGITFMTMIRYTLPFIPMMISQIAFTALPNPVNAGPSGAGRMPR